MPLKQEQFTIRKHPSTSDRAPRRLGSALALAAVSLASLLAGVLIERFVVAQGSPADPGSEREATETPSMPPLLYGEPIDIASEFRPGDPALSGVMHDEGAAFEPAVYGSALPEWSSWVNPPDYWIRLKAIDREEVSEPVQARVNEVLSDYRGSLLEPLGDRVLMVERVEVRSWAGGYGGDWLRAGGTYSYQLNLAITALTYRDVQHSPDFVAATMHHEIGHLVWHQHLNFLERTGWQQMTGLFAYTGDVESFLRDERVTEPTDINTLVAHGIPNTYAATNVREGFAEFVELLMTGDARFWRAYDQSPIIRRKAELVLAAYNRIGIDITLETLRERGRDTRRVFDTSIRDISGETVPTDAIRHLLPQ